MAYFHILSRTALMLGGAFALSGCVTPLPPVSATRFHRIDATSQATPGTYDIVAAGSNDLSLRPDASYTAAVSRQLDLLGFRSVLTNAAGAPDYHVEITVARDEREVRSGSPVSVGVGGATGSYGSGVGVGVGINLNSLFGSGNGTLVTTHMQVRIRRRGEELPIWEGRAEAQARAGTPQAQPGLDADKLAQALFRDFPGTSGQTISVP